MNRERLFARLGHTPYKALIDATALGRSARHAFVDLDHWALCMLRREDSDLCKVLLELQSDVSAVQARLEKALSHIQQSGDSLRDLSPSLERCVAPALSWSQIAAPSGHVRSLHLLLTWLEDDSTQRWLQRLDPRGLGSLTVESLMERFEARAAHWPEAREHSGDGASYADSMAAPPVMPAGAPDSTLARWATNVSEQAQNDALDPVVGRNNELRAVIDILLRRRQNNPILVGEAGVGKTSVVEALAQRIHQGDVPAGLQAAQVWALDIARLQAGASARGEFEQRLRSVIDAVIASEHPIILFCDEAHTLIGAGGAAGTGDAVNLIKPMLARGQLRMIAATTWSEYKQFIEPDAALTRRFQTVPVAEPDNATAIAMLRVIAPRFSKHHGVQITDSALTAAVRLSRRHLPGRQLPDKAISLLDTACARVSMSQSIQPADLEAVHHDILVVNQALQWRASDRRLGLVHEDDDGLQQEQAQLHEKATELSQEIDAQRAQVATETYHRHLQKSLMPELHNLVQKTLTTQTNGGLGDIYLTLKIYLMLANPARRNPDDLEHWVNAQWDGIAQGQFNADDKRTLIEHLRTLFSLGSVPATPQDASMVRAARAKAGQIPSVTRVIQDVRNQGLPAQVSDISLASAAGYGTSMSLRLRSNTPITDPVIPGWFTRAGYNDVFLLRLEKSSRAVLEEESWVLRDETLQGNAFEIDRAVQTLADATRSQYLQDYVTRWQGFLKDITVRNYTGLDDAAQIASSLMDPQSSLAQLIRFTARETTLTGVYDGDLDSWIDRQKHNLEQRRRTVVGEISGDRVRNRLLPEHVLEDQFQAIRRIGTQLGKQDGTAQGNPLTRLFEPIYRQLGLVNGAVMAGQVMPEYDAFARLRNEAARQPEPLRGIMLDLANNGGRMSVQESRDVLTRTASRTTRLVCDQGIAGRYPMLPGAKSEVGVQDFERLFGSQGAMATYFREQLANYVDTTASPWRAKRAQGEEGQLINNGMLRSFEVAERIRTATLDESGRMRVSTILHFVDMDPQLAEAQLEVAGQTLRYSHGSSAPRRVDWSAQNSNLSIKLTLRSIDGRSEVLHWDGPWALFRFYDAARSEDGGTDRKESTYQTGLGTVRLEWQAVTSPSPIWSDLLRSFRCPRTSPTIGNTGYVNSANP